MNLYFTSEGFLLPISKIQIDLPTFEQIFVSGFPNSVTRPRLWANYQAFIQRFEQRVTSHFVQWINGSFVTQKENPNDIDLITFIDYSIFEPMEAEQYFEEFWSYNLEKEGLDSYLLGVYPPEHAKYSKYQKYCHDWYIKYCNAKQQQTILENVKGFIELKFNLSS
ncbi:MAG: hypothetical protein EAZ55_12810 [Cytophagales bacterium]|nr:MAG: hypothetical protein EAZ55_12810 [Cytophagales bacterium]